MSIYIDKNKKVTYIDNVNTAPWPSGKAKVCNTSTPGSNPGGASKEHLKRCSFFMLWNI